MKNLLLKLTLLIGFIIPSIIKSQIGVGPAPYCMPLYGNQPCNQPGPSNSPGNFVNDFINSYNTSGATFNIVNNNSGCNAQNLNGTKNYRLWGCQYYMICSPGQNITSNFQSGIIYSQGCAVFVDWNNDGVYNQAAFTGAVPGGERVTQTAGVPPPAVMTPMPGWIVPNVPAGTYRMRVRCAFSTTGAFIQPCSNYSYGETEEYYVYVNSSPSTMTVNLTSNSPVCIGGQVNINTSILLGPNSGTCSTNTYTYNWTGPMGFTSNQMNPSFTATNVLQSGVYTLNITPPNGCGCNSTNTIQIWVNPNPSTSITNNGPVCKGSSLGFTNNVTGGGTLSFNWSGPNGFSSNTQNLLFASAQPSNTGVYNFTVVSNFTNGGQCVATSQSSAAVVPVAQVSVTPSFTQCQGTNIILTSSVQGATSYTWTGPNLFTSSLSSPTLSNVNPLNSGGYSLTTYFASNQTTLVCSSNAVSNVSVVPMNQVFTSPSQNICQNTNVTFTATAQNNPNYYWIGPNFSSITQSNTLNNISPSSSGIYSVTALWSIGTVSCSTSNSLLLSVVPVNTISVIPQINICVGQNTQLTATTQGAISYTWTGPNNFNVAQPVTQFQNISPVWGGQYTVTAQFTNGSLNCYSSNITDIVVKPNIPFSFAPLNKFCHNQSLNISGPSGATTYSWSGPNFNSSSQNLSIIGLNSNNIGTYSLTVDLNGCKTFGSVFVDVLPPIVWKNLPSNLTLCKGQTYTLITEATNGSGNYAYNWTPSYGLSGPTGSLQIGMASGTTIYNVNVYDIACPQYTINHSFELKVNSAPVPKLDIQTESCEPLCQIYNSKIKNLTQEVIYNFSGNKIYYGDSINICLPKGNYSLNITSVGLNGCREVFSFPSMVNVYPLPTADFSWSPFFPNTISNNVVTFYPTNQENHFSWSWEINSITSGDKTPTEVFEVEGKFPITLVVATEYGCKDTVTKVIEVKEELSIFVPNAFTPNGDGINDVFKPKGLGVRSYDMIIFDEWGNQIYSGKSWDGTFKGQVCQDDIYVYKITVIDNRGLRHEKTGHVTLLK